MFTIKESSREGGNCKANFSLSVPSVAVPDPTNTLLVTDQFQQFSMHIQANGEIYIGI